MCQNAFRGFRFDSFLQRVGSPVTGLDKEKNELHLFYVNIIINIMLAPRRRG